MPTVLLPALLLLALSACSGSGSSLDGTEWRSVRVMDGDDELPLLVGTQVRLRFADGSLSASADCNTIGGSYRVEGGQLVAGDLGQTAMGCDDERHAQDSWLAAFLASRPRMAVAGGEMTLTAGDEVIVLLDREVAEPDLGLIGPIWTVDSIISGDAVSSVPNGTEATLVFREDGTVEVDTGCNTGSGRYETDGETLRVSDLMTTLSACDQATGMLEGAVLGVLNAGEIQLRIEGGSLTLMAGEQGLGLQGR